MADNEQQIQKLREQAEQDIKRGQERLKLLEDDPDGSKARSALTDHILGAADALSLLIQLNPAEKDTWITDNLEAACEALGIKGATTRTKKDTFAKDGNGYKFLVAIKDEKPHAIKGVYQTLVLPLPEDLTKKNTLVAKAVEKKFVELTGDNVKITKVGKGAIIQADADAADTTNTPALAGKP